jgi:hypothetical protein
MRRAAFSNNFFEMPLRAVAASGIRTGSTNRDAHADSYK